MVDVRADVLSITEAEIVESTKQLHVNKSPGLDGICVEVYKCIIGTIFLPFLKELFNEMFDNSDFPDDWSKSLITPLHKKRPIIDPNNFRGIFLIDSLCKSFMNSLSLRLTKWCDELNVIDEAQAGFRKKYSTIDNCLTPMSLMQKSISMKKCRFYCIFVHYAKTFDSIDHEKLWDAFARKDVDGNFLMYLSQITHS